MRLLQIVLIGVLVALLSVIAIDLHRVARALAPVGALSAGFLSLGETRATTRAQQIEEQKRFIRSLDEQIDIGAEASRQVMREQRAKGHK